MFSREIINEYGDYTIKSKDSVLLKGRFDKNFLEVKTIDPTQIQYKVFDSTNINFAVRIGNSTYIPSNIFTKLQTSYKEGNPYFTAKDVITIDLDISKTLSFIDSKFNVKTQTNQVTYAGSETKYTTTETKTTTSTITTKSGSVDVQQSAVITSNAPVEKTIMSVSASFTNAFATRLELAGVKSVSYPFYINNDPNQLNDDNVIRYIQYLFEDVTTQPKGTNSIVPYENADGTVIVQNLPASTDVVRPVTQRVTNLDGYLRDVERT
jgi:uncharacterized protein YdeI (BOF family)